MKVGLGALDIYGPSRNRVRDGVAVRIKNPEVLAPSIVDLDLAV
jgi:hypothetical protein